MPFPNFRPIKISGKPKSFLLKLFLQISILSISLVLFISFILYNNYTKESIDTISFYNQKLLSQTCNNFEFMDKYINDLALNIYSNDEAKYLMSCNNKDITTQIQYINDMSNLVFNIPFVHSIYLYNGKMSSFYCLNPSPMIRNKSEMFDKEIGNILNDSAYIENLTPIARIIPYSGYEQKKSVDTYTYIFSVLDVNTKKVTDAVVINVNAGWFFNVLNATAQKQFGENTLMMVINKKGTVYGHTQINLFKSNIADRDYIKKILTSSSTSGFFRSNVENVNSVVNYQYLNGSDLVFIIITPNNHMADFVKRIRLTSVLVCLCAILLGLLLSYLLSLNFYNPVKNLYKNVKEFLTISEPSSKSLDKKNEFEFISNTITQISGKMNTLESFKSSSMDIIKQQYLFSLLTGNSDTIETIAEKFAQYNVNLKPDAMFILILYKVDRYTDFINRFDVVQQSEMKQQFYKIIYGKLFGISDFECINLENDQTIILIHVNENVSLETAILPLVDDIQSSARKLLAVSFSAAINDPCPDMTGLNTIYAQTLELLQYRLKFGSSCILTSSVLMEIRSENIILHTSLVKNLVDALKNEARVDLEKYHKDYFNYLAFYSPKNIRYGLSYLSVSVFDIIHIIGNNSTIEFNINFVDFNNRINALETLSEINECFTSLYEQILDKIKESRESKTDIIINTVKKYIAANYTDRNLSLNSIADAVNMNPVYLGKLFKNMVYKPVSEYINEVRIAKAVELMQNSSFTIDDILEKVSWESKKYFFTVFKNQYGVTPNEYRLSNNIKHMSG